ncbi:MAG: RNA-binding S4 domain-containing protein [Candidatus Delongbacteria bacterium]|nr:RNA-binding S4 domain-containing protein [Candidatus Delongbacteria bacterium]MBN2834128.1 RNA-binding S4 domain-containing protein [Candidatus Delongbacteria bacterium]
MEENLNIRIDKWLKISRFFKQRELAAEEVEKGHVKVNHERVKPAKIIKIGDELTIKKDSQYIKVKVKGITFKSVSAELAKDLYEIIEDENKPVGIQAEYMEILRKQDIENQKENRGKGRPTKKDRRILNKYKYSN